MDYIYGKLTENLTWRMGMGKRRNLWKNITADSLDLNVTRFWEKEMKYYEVFKTGEF